MTSVFPLDVPVWRNRPFLRLWVAQAITQVAQNAIWYALLVVVEKASHSTTQLGITILSVVVPSVLFGVPAGVYVDRWDKGTVLLVTNLLRAVAAIAFVPVVALTETAVAPTLVMLYVVSFLFSVITQFFAPAESAVIPALVARPRLLQANSFFHLTFTASQFVGLILVGPLIVKLFGELTFFLVTAVLYGLSALLVWNLPAGGRIPKAAGPAHPVRELVEQLRDVVALLRQDRQMLHAMGYLTLAGGLTLVVAMLAPRFVVDVLGIAAADAVLVLAPAGIGMLAAAFFLSRPQASLVADRQRLITGGLLVVSLALASAAAVPTIGRFAGLIRPGGAIDVVTHSEVALFGVVMLATLFAGVGFAAILVVSQTIVQERAPAEARGRVIAVQLMLGNLVSIIPLLSIGGLADVIGIPPVLIVLAAAVLVVTYFSYRRQPGQLRMAEG